MTLDDFMRICEEEGFDCHLVASMQRADGGEQRVGFTLPLREGDILANGTESAIRSELRIASIAAHSFKREDMVRDDAG